MFGTTSGSAPELPGPASSASRLDLLLNLISSSTSDPAQADEVLVLISQSGLLANISQDETRHKLTVRINSLISSQNALGYRLAHLWIQQNPAAWDEYLVSNASTWATQIINLLSAPEKLLTQRDQSDRLLAAALQLAVTHLFPEGIASRQEFYRQVVHPNLPKVVVGLTHLLEAITAKQETEGNVTFETHLHTVLVFLDRLLHAHPAQFRPVSSRIHASITSFLYRDDAHLLPRPIFNAAAAVLSSLHLTGALASKGSDASGGSARTTQAQLWLATLESQLRLASEAWRHASSSYQVIADDASASGLKDAAPHKGFQPYPKDPLAATRIAHNRLSLLLGSRGRSGLINLHLRSATSRPVPIPVGKILNLALDMLAIDLTSRFKPTAEAKLCSLQASHLPTLHTRALALIAQLAINAPAAIPLEASRVLGDICRLAEASAASDAGSARVKLAAMRTLAILVGREGTALPLDPAGRTTLRLARLAAKQVASSVLQPAQPTSSAAAGDAGRKAKKARLYESDSIFGTSVSPKDRIHALTPEEIASTQAALSILVAVYPLLTTSLSAAHYDLLNLSIQNVLALVEVLSDSIGSHSTQLRAKSAGSGAPTPTDLLQGAMEALAEMCLNSASSTLAVVLPKAIPLLTRIANAPSGAGDARVRSAAEKALVTVHASRKGKFVPVAKGVGFGPKAADDFEAVPEGAKLGGASDIGHAIPTTSESLESSLAKATTTVLGASGREATNAEEDEEERTQDEGRMDVDAITAESAELFKATAADTNTAVPSSSAATPSSSSNAIGLGLPTSPLRSPQEKRILSPDPVKPTHRPSTPRIGSPSTAGHPPALSRHSSPSLDVSATGSPSFLTPGRSSQPAQASQAAKEISDSAVIKAAESMGPEIISQTAKEISDSAIRAAEALESEEVAEAVEEVIKDAALADVPATEMTITEARTMFLGDDDDDDEEMPEIDMGESDDEGDDGGDEDEAGTGDERA